MAATPVCAAGSGSIFINEYTAMLNYLWLALIVIGILTAAGRDIYDAAENSYGNGIPWSVTIPANENENKTLDVHFTAADMQKHFPDAPAHESAASASVYYHSKQKASVRIALPSDAPPQLAAIAEAQGNDGELTGTMHRSSGETWMLTLDPVSFIYMKRITNAAFDAAQLAVTIALGLIGIMALWLGIMKIAEEAGLVRIVAKAVAPITRRLFPDVPHDHPAVTSMMMNIAANMLGLGNAATPFGLKAMEELNTLNPKAGTATNAMVTFLALNTSCITLIPATAIAVRAASGSNDPAAIIGTTFLASLTATITGVTVAKLFQRMRIFRMKTEEGA